MDDLFFSPHDRFGNPISSFEPRLKILLALSFCRFVKQKGDFLLQVASLRDLIIHSVTAQKKLKPLPSMVFEGTPFCPAQLSVLASWEKLAFCLRTHDDQWLISVSPRRRLHMLAWSIRRGCGLVKALKARVKSRHGLCCVCACVPMAMLTTPASKFSCPRRFGLACFGHYAGRLHHQHLRYLHWKREPSTKPRLFVFVKRVFPVNDLRVNPAASALFVKRGEECVQVQVLCSHRRRNPFRRTPRSFCQQCRGMLWQDWWCFGQACRLGRHESSPRPGAPSKWT